MNQINGFLNSFGLGSKSPTTPSSPPTPGSGRGGAGSRRKRCPRGSRRSKTGECVKVGSYTAKKRCPRGTRRNPKTGSCEKIEMILSGVSKSKRSMNKEMKAQADKINQAAAVIKADVVELKKADAALASATEKCCAAARAAAKAKREKKSASNAARAQGKVAAAEARAKAADDHEKEAEKEREQLLAKITRARKAMGIRKNEDNPASLRKLIEEWQLESRMRLFKRNA